MGACQSRDAETSAAAVLDRTKHTIIFGWDDGSSAFLGGESSTKKNATSKPPSPSPPAASSNAILRQIEELQRASHKPFGRILDVGTGFSSLAWIHHLLSDKDNDSHNNKSFGVTGWTAVTAAEAMGQQLKIYAQQQGMNAIHNNTGNKKNQGLVIGNWFDGYPTFQMDTINHVNIDNNNSPSLLLEGELFDTILVDYFIGAVDGYTPYLQDCIWDRLQSLVKPGGRMYIVGMEPIPESIPCDPHQNLLCRVKRIRDACILLSGKRCYREYPLSWVLRTLSQAPHWQVLGEARRYPLQHSAHEMLSQLETARSHLSNISIRNGGDESLADALEGQIGLLEQTVISTFRHKRQQKQPEFIVQGFDYLVIAERVDGL